MTNVLHFFRGIRIGCRRPADVAKFAKIAVFTPPGGVMSPQIYGENRSRKRRNFGDQKIFLKKC